MKENKFKEKIGKLIFYFAIGIFVVVGILAVLKAYTGTQVWELLTLLIPFKAIYITAFIPFLISNKYKSDDNANTTSKDLSSLYIQVSYTIIILHFVALLSVITMSGLSGDFISFQTLTKWVIPAIEGVFGGLTGLIIPDIFRVSK